MCFKRGKVVTRRSATLGLAASIASAAGPYELAPADNALELLPPLRRLAQASGSKFGCAAGVSSVQPDATLLRKIATEANIFVPEVHLKWEFTEPRPNEFDFTAADSIADFACPPRHDHARAYVGLACADS